MNQKLITLTIASAFAITSGIAFAAGPNDAFNYPNAESRKIYTDQRIMDHNNAAPRYPVAAAAAGQAGNQNARALNTTPRYAVRRHVPRATHAARTSVHPG